MITLSPRTVPWCAPGPEQEVDCASLFTVAAHNIGCERETGGIPASDSGGLGCEVNEADGHCGAVGQRGDSEKVCQGEQANTVAMQVSNVSYA